MPKNDIRVKLSADNKTARAFRQVKSDAVAVAGKVGLLSAAVAGLAGVGGMGALVAQSFKTADAFGKMSDRLNVSTEAFAAFALQAELSGTSSASVNSSLERMVKRLGEAKNGMGAAKTTLAQLNLDVDKLASMQADKAYLEIADAIAQLGTHTEQAAATAAIFGREGVSMLNMIKQGREGFNAASEAVDKFGTALSREQVQRIEDANDAMTIMQQSLKGVAMTIAVEVAPQVTKFINWLFDIEQSIETMSEAQLKNRLADITTEIQALNEQLVATRSGESPVNPAIVRQMEALGRQAGEVKQKLAELNREAAGGGGAAAPDNTAELQRIGNALRLQDEQRFIEEKQRMQEEARNLELFAEAQKLQEIQRLEQARVDAAEASAEARKQVAVETLGNLAVLTASTSRTLFNVGKAASIASAIINTHEAVTKTMASVPYPLNIPLAAAQAAAGFVQVQNIRNQQFQAREHGGPVRAGVPYLVGERRPEIFVPNNSGAILPAKNGIGGNNTVNVTVIANDAQSFADQQNRTADNIWNIIVNRMNEEGLRFA